MRFVDHSPQDVYIHAIEWITGRARFQHTLDRVDMLGRERVHLLPCFVRRFRQPYEIGEKPGA